MRRKSTRASQGSSTEAHSVEAPKCGGFLVSDATGPTCFTFTGGSRTRTLQRWLPEGAFQITICFKSEQHAGRAHALLLRTFAGTEDVWSLDLEQASSTRSAPAPTTSSITRTSTPPPPLLMMAIMSLVEFPLRNSNLIELIIMARYIATPEPRLSVEWHALQGPL